MYVMDSGVVSACTLAGKRPPCGPPAANPSPAALGTAPAIAAVTGTATGALVRFTTPDLSAGQLTVVYKLQARCARRERPLGQAASMPGCCHTTLCTPCSLVSVCDAPLQAYEKDRTTEIGSPVQVAATVDGTTGTMFVANVTVAPAAQRAFAVLAAAGTKESQLSAVSTVVVAGELQQLAWRSCEDSNCMVTRNRTAWCHVVLTWPPPATRACRPARRSRWAERAGGKCHRYRPNHPPDFRCLRHGHQLRRTAACQWHRTGSGDPPHCHRRCDIVSSHRSLGHAAARLLHRAGKW